jgi:hypothetical protein
MKPHFLLFTICACLLVAGIGFSSIPGTATLCNLLYTCSAVAGVLASAFLWHDIERGEL